MCRLDTEYAMARSFEISQQSPIVRPNVNHEIGLTQRANSLALAVQIKKIFPLHSSRAAYVGIVIWKEKIPAQNNAQLDEVALWAVEGLGRENRLLFGPLIDGVKLIECRHVAQEDD